MLLETKDYRTFNIINDEGECINTIEGVEKIIPALPGDKVLECGTFIKRVDHPAIVGILHLTSKVRYGMTSKGKPIYLFEPINKSYPYMIVGSGEKGATSNVIALVKFESWDLDSKIPRGALQEILGPCGDLNVETKMLLHRYSPWSLPKKAEISANYAEHLDRRPFIDGYTFNIDPPGCQDVDDVITINKVGNKWNLVISITDVATGIEEGSLLDNYAKKVGQTLYPDSAEPKHMLPPSISTRDLSLLKGYYRNTISLTLVWSPQDGIESTKWSCSKVTVDRAYTYKEAQIEQREEFQILKDIVNNIAKIPRETSEEWVETLMIYYNSEAGKLLKANAQGILRHHSEPDIEKLRYMSAIDPSLEKMAFSAAKYVTSDSVGRHWGLDTDHYAHASSPLRRYADLYNQRCLLAILKNGPPVTQNPKPLCRQLNILQKNSKAFERDEFFITTLAKTKQPILVPVVVEFNEEKQYIKLWVKEWNRIIRIKISIIMIDDGFYITAKDGTGGNIKLKEQVILTYNINYNKASWKDKIIFGVHIMPKLTTCADINCPE